jgi:hypothetical protein
MSYKLDDSDWARVGASEGDWVCGICGTEFSTENELERHIETKHSTILRRKLRS